MDTKTGTEVYQGKRERLAREVEDMATQAGEYVRHVSSRVGGKLQSVRTSLTEAQTAAAERAREAADMTDKYVHMNPWKSLGVAALAGLLVGVLLTRTLK